MGLAGHVARIKHTELSFGETEWKRTLGRPRQNWEDNIRMDLRERGWEGVYWIHLVKNRDHWWAVVNTVMNLIVP
jgi:hypothetical protein